jgi:hypothetical protein
MVPLERAETFARTYSAAGPTQSSPPVPGFEMVATVFHADPSTLIWIRTVAEAPAAE